MHSDSSRYGLGIATTLQPAARAEVELKEGRVERAIKILEGGYALRRRQFFIKAQIDAQIGAAQYMARKYKEAEPYLKNAMRTDPVARGMYAAVLFRRHKLDEATEVLEEILKGEALKLTHLHLNPAGTAQPEVQLRDISWPCFDLDLTR